MRATELVLVVPRFFLAVVVIALFGAGLGSPGAPCSGLTSWPVIARVVRAEALSLARRDFVDAARALGAAEAADPAPRTSCPNALPAALVVISLNAASVILLEAGLAFLGLGDPDVMSWGYLANNAQRFLRVAWWMAAVSRARPSPSRSSGLNLLGDALNDVPRTRARAGERARGGSRPSRRRSAGSVGEPADRRHAGRRPAGIRSTPSRARPPPPRPSS